jgi:hypothetical protein
MKVLSFFRIFGFIGIACFATQGAAASVSRADITTWLNQVVTMDPPAAGTVVTDTNLDLVRPFMPPGYVDEFSYSGSSITIQETKKYPLFKAYQDATNKYAGQPTLGAGGELENYQAGQPFSNEQIAAASAEHAGLMVAWNNIYRWQFTGYQVSKLAMTYIDQGDGKNGKKESSYGIEGDGRIERRVIQEFHRVYLSNLAMLPKDGYKMKVPSAADKYFKDYIEFSDPFDIAGMKFVVERAQDAHADDQVNVYSPTERRVRRYSAKERSDSFMGSEVTLDDFDGFAGRVLDYQWDYLGTKKLLDVIDTEGKPIRFGGPFSRAIIDRWQLRNCHVVEVKSTWDGHPYKSKIIFIDDETFDIANALVFNQKDELWKIFDAMYRSPKIGETEAEKSVVSWRGQSNINLITNRATLVHAMSDTIHPTMKPSKIKRLFSVSSLTSGQ